jgi:cell fate regulator YaaT (PSP1 superfamily)
MARAVKLAFGTTMRTQYTLPRDFPLREGDAVISETDWGNAVGWVVAEYASFPVEALKRPHRQVLRLATPQDLSQSLRIRDREKEAKALCAERVKERGLAMKLTEVRFSLEGSRGTFFFTAEERVDFRELVKDLARSLRARIEFRQIGARDEARLAPGCIGPCGRILCCQSWLKEFHPVSVKMAKDQAFSLNPSRLLGMCGRLKCCLAYEWEMYRDVRAGLPKVGTQVMTHEGPGQVVDHLVLEESLLVELAETKARLKCRAADVAVPRPEGAPDPFADRPRGLCGGACAVEPPKPKPPSGPD